MYDKIPCLIYAHIFTDKHIMYSNVLIFNKQKTGEKLSHSLEQTFEKMKISNDSR